MTVVFIGERRLLVILLPFAACNRVFAKLFFVSLEPPFVLIESVPVADLLGYLRKSRGLNATYYKDLDIKPLTNPTSQQLMRFAWQIANGMTYLSSIPVSDIIIL